MARSKWKGPFVDIYLLNALKVQKPFYKVFSRASVILPEFLGLVFKVYNGRYFTQIKVEKNMINRRFGEFALTKRRGHLIHKPKKKRRKNKK
jgi:small subunit ribosomal protein S19